MCFVCVCVHVCVWGRSSAALCNEPSTDCEASVFKGPTLQGHGWVTDHEAFRWSNQHTHSHTQFCAHKRRAMCKVCMSVSAEPYQMLFILQTSKRNKYKDNHFGRVTVGVAHCCSAVFLRRVSARSEEHTSELQSQEQI